MRPGTRLYIKPTVVDNAARNYGNKIMVEKKKKPTNKITPAEHYDVPRWRDRNRPRPTNEAVLETPGKKQPFRVYVRRRGEIPTEWF